MTSLRPAHGPLTLRHDRISPHQHYDLAGSQPKPGELGGGSIRPFLQDSTRASHVDEWTRKLAELAVSGANVQPGQLVGVTAFVGMEEITRAIARSAYMRGARYVDVLYFDNVIKRERLAHAPEDSLDYVPPWLGQRLLSLANDHAARLRLAGPHAPAALADIDPARTGRDLLPFQAELLDVINRRTTNWCNVPAPTRAWAQAVYPDLESEEAYARLWEAIAWICRLDADDPATAWERRIATLKNVAGHLTRKQIDAVRLRGPGTDLTIGLLPSSRWLPVEMVTVDGVRHFPNIPTEEIMTTPDPARADGYVSATMPLDLYGTIVTEIRLEFVAGEAVRIDARSGAEALRSTIAKDEGARRLGELALVDRTGRIGPLATVFLEALIDENAATHIALGSGYEHPVGDESDRARINKSGIHVDVMVGSASLRIDAITKGGEEIPILHNAGWTGHATSS